jgi:hypothetical protein
MLELGATGATEGGYGTLELSPVVASDSGWGAKNAEKAFLQGGGDRGGAFIF